MALSTPIRKQLSVDALRLLVLQLTGVIHTPNLPQTTIDQLVGLRGEMTDPAYVDIKSPYPNRLSRPLMREIRQFGRLAKQHPEWLSTEDELRIVMGDGHIQNYFGIVTGIADDESYVSLIIGPTFQEAMFFFQTDRVQTELVVYHQTRPI